MHCYILGFSYTYLLFFECLIFALLASFDVQWLCMCTQILNRVKQIVGFEAEDLIGQELMNFFHPKEMNGYEHTKCKRLCKILSFVHTWLTISVLYHVCSCAPTCTNMYCSDALIIYPYQLTN